MHKLGFKLQEMFFCTLHVEIVQKDGQAPGLFTAFPSLLVPAVIPKMKEGETIPASNEPTDDDVIEAFTTSFPLEEDFTVISIEKTRFFNPVPFRHEKEKGEEIPDLPLMPELKAKEDEKFDPEIPI